MAGTYGYPRGRGTALTCAKRGGNVGGKTPAAMENSAAGGSYCRGRANNRRRKRSVFLELFALARRLLPRLRKICAGRTTRRMREFCHAVCPGSRLVRDGGAPVA